MNYTNREVVRRLKQYDMFLNSLNLTTDEVQKERICDQLDKIEKQILLETNSEYEEQYMLLLSEEVRFISEEKTRLRNLISLILERKKYLEERKNKHKKVTGSLVELTTFLGEDKLNTFKNRLEIIEKYEENKKRQEAIIKEMKSLDVKLSEASRTVKANARLNDILENKMMAAVGTAIDKFNFYPLTSRREEILKKCETLEYALNIAEDNLKIAKKLEDGTTILECEEMLAQISKEYSGYNEQVNILKLIDIYDRPVSTYDELLEKREKMNDILKSISDSELYKQIADELNKEYNTIKLEKQDIENYEFLKQERERKNKLLYEIEEENTSKEFKQVIDELVKNENRIREERVRRAKKEEYQERQKKLLEEQKIEASRVRRQKLIEEARLKEQKDRVEKVKELQEKTVITPREEEKIINPLKNKTFEEMMNLSSDFDTDELFENTKIVPNKIVQSETSLFEDTQNNKDNLKEETVLPTWGEPNVLEEKTLFDDIKLEEKPLANISEPPIAQMPKANEEPIQEEVLDLFKEEPKVEEVSIPKEESLKEEKASIYDILENNKNIIWKTTEKNANTSTIPVIGNNNLKPEILDSKKVTDIEFPKLDNKEGEILWKETI